MITIEKVDNGYIVTDSKLTGKKEVFYHLRDVFRTLLQKFEGRQSCFGGDLYGDVIIKRTKEANQC